MKAIFEQRVMSIHKQTLEQQEAQMLRLKNSGLINCNASPLVNDEKEEEMTRSALAAFRAKEEEIERKKTEIRERVQAQLGRVEVETKKLAEIREVSWILSLFLALFGLYLVNCIQILIIYLDYLYHINWIISLWIPIRRF